MPAGKIPLGGIIGHDLPKEVEQFIENICISDMINVLKITHADAEMMILSHEECEILNSKLINAVRVLCFNQFFDGENYECNKMYTNTEAKKYLRKLSYATMDYFKNKNDNKKDELIKLIKEKSIFIRNYVSTLLVYAGVERRFAIEYYNIILSATYYPRNLPLQKEVLQVIDALEHVESTSISPDSIHSALKSGGSNKSTSLRKSYTHSNPELITFILSVSEIWRAVTGYSSVYITDSKRDDVTKGEYLFYNYLSFLFEGYTGGKGLNRFFHEKTKITIRKNFIRDLLVGRVGHVRREK